MTSTLDLSDYLFRIYRCRWLRTPFHICLHLLDTHRPTALTFVQLDFVFGVSGLFSFLLPTPYYPFSSSFGHPPSALTASHETISGSLGALITFIVPWKVSPNPQTWSRRSASGLRAEELRLLICIRQSLQPVSCAEAVRSSLQLDSRHRTVISAQVPPIKDCIYNGPGGQVLHLFCIYPRQPIIRTMDERTP